MTPATKSKSLVPRRLASSARQAILILGMHRSGTSALAGVVNSLGGSAPRTLLESNIYNPRGFWESAPLIKANDDLLASAGSNWDDWRQFDPQWVHSNAAKRDGQKIKRILLEEFDDAPLFVIKDPRICRFVPFITSILDEMKVRSVAFLPLRNPLEVAYSLRRRDGFTLPKALLLWLRHVLDAEHDSRGIPRFFLNFEDMLMDWRSQLDRAAEAVGIIWPTRSHVSEASIEQFLTMELYHEKSTLKSMQSHQDVSNLVIETYDILRTIAAKGESNDLIARLDVVRTKFNEGCDIFGAVTAAEELAARKLCEKLSQQTAETGRVQETSRAALIAQEEKNKGLVADLGAVTQQVKGLRATLTERETSSQRLAAELRASTEELQELRATLTGTEASNGRLRADLHASAKEAEDLRATLTERETSSQRLAADLRASAKEAEGLRSALTEKEANNQRVVANFQESVRELAKLRIASIQHDIDEQRRTTSLRQSKIKDGFLETVVHGVYNGFLWRVIRPFRRI